MSEALEVKVATLEQRCKSNTHRIGKLEENTEAVNKLALAMEAMSVKQDYTVTGMDRLNEKMDGMDGRIDTIESKPGKRWELLVTTIIAVAVTAVITFLLTQLGM